MPCYHPITVWRSSAGRNPNGAWPIVFNVKQGYQDMELKIPCRKCVGCRLEQSRQWAMRCMHEQSLYSRNCFITLTFNDDYLDPEMSLRKPDYQKFMKRLRKRFGDGIRYFHCGEYGSLHARPHHHAIIFNFDFPDKYLWTVKRGCRLYRSPSLEQLWPYGNSVIGDVTFESCAYVARYIMKKITGKMALYQYNTIDYETGELLSSRIPEYVTMSLKPGIGRGWFEKYYKDVYPADVVIMRNDLKLRPPKYYDKLYDLQDPSSYVKIKLRRKRLAAKNTDNTPDRLKVRENIQLLRAAKLLRTLD